MSEPEFFSPDWAANVRDALTAGPTEAGRAGKLTMYWDFFDRVKAEYASSWSLGCGGLPDGESGSLFIQWSGGEVTECYVTQDQPAADYVATMDYADWQALHEGYDPQRTVMYRKIQVTEGNILEFFKSIYFFTECLGVIGQVPAGFHALAVH
jgi:hypothetical protein